ncbi:hypothetical protein BU17DRAFT_92093 [Hysterangium stoloniferum]|nr:hypothetical protein BU17DRAFT_92093 [Hysterangium stoloniferum]
MAVGYPVQLGMLTYHHTNANAAANLHAQSYAHTHAHSINGTGNGNGSTPTNTTSTASTKPLSLRLAPYDSSCLPWCIFTTGAAAHFPSMDIFDAPVFVPTPVFEVAQLVPAMAVLPVGRLLTESWMDV